MKQAFKIGIIGAGNMGQAMLNGFLKHGISTQLLSIADPKQARCQQLNQEHHIFSTTDNVALAKSVDILILAVKPQQMKVVITEIAPSITQQLIISVAAGIESDQINEWLNDKKASIVRAMPNTPVVIAKGMIALFANSYVTETQKEAAQSLMNALGEVVWLTQESHMHAATALSGSGPAYFFYMMESMVRAGISMGLSETVSKRLILQTALGSVTMAIESDQTLETLRHNVTSKGGTTEAGIQTLQEGQFLELIIKAIQNSAQRSQELSEVSSIK